MVSAIVLISALFFDFLHPRKQEINDHLFEAVSFGPILPFITIDIFLIELNII
jgi:hypothetical protein